jgi:acetyl esterase
MPLHPQAQALLDQLAAAGDIDLTQLPAPAVREIYAQMSLSRIPVEIPEVSDRTISGPGGALGLRVYRPEAGARPALVYYHGGGFVIGSLDTHDGTCRALARASGCTVISVDYRLAPEHRFPAAPEDCYAALCFAAEAGAEIGVDPTRLAVGGDSAGGNLALLARERRGPPLAFQLLVYPVTDAGFDTPSYRENAEGYFLTAKMMRWFWNHYLERADQADDPLASPLRAKDLAGLPPALVLTAGYDPLRDEGETYAARLREAGVATELKRFPGQFHGFFSMHDVLDDGRAAIDLAGAALRRALSA